MLPYARRLIIYLYRIFGITALFAVLIGVVGYAFLMGFYAVNTSWVAPTILHPSDRVSLDLTQKIITIQQSLNALQLDKRNQESGIGEMRKHKAALQALAPELAVAIVRERNHNQQLAPQLVSLTGEKHLDNAKRQSLVQGFDEVEGHIDRELSAGLITKADAIAAKAQIWHSHSDLIDSQIYEVLMKDNILEKDTLNTRILDVLDKQAELQSAIEQLEIKIATAEDQVRADAADIQRLENAINTATETPYYLAMTRGSAVYFAFVPYDNEKNVIPGSPIHDCYLNMIFCRRVGTVKRVFNDEEKAVHPIFKTEVRGFLIQLDLTDPEAAKSKVLFVGKPMFI